MSEDEDWYYDYPVLDNNDEDWWDDEPYEDDEDDKDDWDGFVPEEDWELDEDIL